MDDEMRTALGVGRLRGVEVVDAMREMGGVATRSALVRATSRHAVDEALAGGVVIAVARGRYALADVEEAVATAHGLSGVLCLTSAALHHGWAVKTVPDRPHVAVARKRNLDAQRRGAAHLHYLDLSADDVVDGIATDKTTTLVHCLRRLPRDAALAVADSAMRAGDQAALRAAAARARGPGSRQVRQVAALARAEAANPFESVLRDIASDVPGLHVEPQVLITTTSPWCRPDLVDRDLLVAIEADSFEWHGGRAALARDARRYNLLVADGWVVLRFAWEDVMFDPAYVRSVLGAVVRRQAQRGRSSTSAA